MRALVTGGAGFLGSGLVDRLVAEGHAVEVVDDLSTGSLANLADARGAGGAMRFHQVDVRDAGCTTLVERLRPDVVFHLAAPPGEDTVSGEPVSGDPVSGDPPPDDPIRHVEVGLIGLIRVLAGAQAAGSRKVVFASSWTTYGALEPDDLPVREHAAQRPRSSDGIAKRAALDLLASAREHHGLEFSALALSSVYGPRQLGAPHAGFVAGLVQALVEGDRWAVADRGVTRDFLFVDDAVDALSRAADRGSGLLINVGSGTETSLDTLARLAGDVAGTPARFVATPKPPAASSPRVALDPTRAEIHLGWRPFTNLRDGLAAMVAAARAGASGLAPAAPPHGAGDARP